MYNGEIIGRHFSFKSFVASYPQTSVIEAFPVFDSICILQNVSTSLFSGVCIRTYAASELSDTADSKGIKEMTVNHSPNAREI